MKLSIIIYIVSFTLALANNQNIKKLDWEGIDIVWIEDNSVPTFSVQVYFADGALSDKNGYQGETELMFDSLFSGTNRFTQKQITDNLEFFGANFSSSVIHEYSIFSFSGLAKDIVPITKKVCHLFQDSIFPKNEIKTAKRRITSSLQNLETNHSALADRALRHFSMKDSLFETPVGGTLKTIRNIQTRHLKDKLNYFNKNVQKKIYIRGKRDALKVSSIFTKECEWNGAQNFRRTLSSVKDPKQKGKIVLIPVKSANQAQIRFGQYLPLSKIKSDDLLVLSSGYLGGGFISVLTQEVRVKRGLTYSIGAVARSQKYYGRSTIMTFSRNDKVAETISIIRDILNQSKEGVDEGSLLNMKNYLKGSHLFQFESNDSFLRNLMSYDHMERSWSDLYNFPKTVESFNSKDVSETIGKVFGEENTFIIVVGSKSLLKSLKTIGPVEVVSKKVIL